MYYNVYCINTGYVQRVRSTITDKPDTVYDAPLSALTQLQIEV